MKVRSNRLYPYPVFSELSNDFNDNTFNVERTLEYDSKLATIRIGATINDTKILDLINNGKLSFYCHVECPTTKYRELFTIPKENVSDYTITIDFALLNENIEIMCMLVAQEDIVFDDDNLNDFYKDEVIIYPKYATVGYTDTDVVTITKKIDMNGEVPSIFQISLTETDDEISYNADDEQIYIFLPKKEYQIYFDSLGTYRRLKQLMINVAVLVAVLDEVKTDYETYSSRGWFSVIEEKLGSLAFEDMESEKFKSTSSLSLAQLLLGEISFDGFKEFEDLREKVGGMK